MVEEGSFSPRENFTPHNLLRPARFYPYTAIYFRRNIQPPGRKDLSAPARGHDGSTVSNVVVTSRNVPAVIPYGSAVTNSDDRKAHWTGRPHIVKEISVPPRVDAFPHSGLRPAHVSLYVLMHIKNIVRPPRHLGPSVPACEHGGSTVPDVMVRDTSGANSFDGSAVLNSNDRHADGTVPAHNLKAQDWNKGSARSVETYDQNKESARSMDT
jgi:hypothetical protein